MIFAEEKSERGRAFILALMVVAAVGLLVVPVIYLATTGLRSTNLAQQRFLERYAVEARTSLNGDTDESNILSWQVE